MIATNSCMHYKEMDNLNKPRRAMNFIIGAMHDGGYIEMNCHMTFCEV